MARDILSIPYIADEAERIFSFLEYLVSPRRSKIQSKLIQASECLGYQDREGFIKIGTHLLEVQAVNDKSEGLTDIKTEYGQSKEEDEVWQLASDDDDDDDE